MGFGEVIPLKLPEDVLEESRRNAHALKISRSEYMRRAIERMNREARAELRAKRLAAASKQVRAESMKAKRRIRGQQARSGCLIAERSGSEERTDRGGSLRGLVARPQPHCPRPRTQRGPAHVEPSRGANGLSEQAPIADDPERGLHM